MGTRNKDHDAMVTRYQEEVERLKTENKELKSERDQLKARETTIIQVLATATADADRIKTDAQAEADRIKQEAKNYYNRLETDAQNRATIADQRAQSIIDAAKKEAVNLQNKADAYCSQKKQEADDAIENSRTVANNIVAEILQSMQDELMAINNETANIMSALRKIAAESAQNSKKFSGIAYDITKKLKRRAEDPLKTLSEKINACEASIIPTEEIWVFDEEEVDGDSQTSTKNDVQEVEKRSCYDTNDDSQIADPDADMSTEIAGEIPKMENDICEFGLEVDKSEQQQDFNATVQAANIPLMSYSNSMFEDEDDEKAPVEPETPQATIADNAGMEQQTILPQGDSVQAASTPISATAANNQSANNNTDCDLDALLGSMLNG